jgi:ATP-binding cassette, subfamily B, bacterial MsbA
MSFPSRPAAVDRPEQSKQPPSRPDFSQFPRLLVYVRPYLLPLALAFVATLGASGLGLLFPGVVGRLIDNSLAKGGTTAPLDQAILWLVVAFLIQALLSAAQTYLLSYVGEKVVADIRLKLYDHLLSLPLAFFENRKIGEITSRLTSDAATVQGAVSGTLASSAQQALQLLAGVVIIFITNWKLSLLMLAVVPVVILAASYFGRRLRKISTAVQDKVAEANAAAEEAMGGIRVVQSFTAEPFERERYKTGITASLQAALARAQVRAAFGPSVTFAIFSAISTVLWFGGRLVLAGELTVGQLSAFLLYTFVVAGSIGAFTGIFTQIQESLGASKRIFELLDTPSSLPEAETPQKIANITGAVHFNKVAFRYGDRGEGNILSQISLTAAPGEVVALVGPSGAGKSTLVALIPRFYDVSEGSITIDGVDIRQLSLSDLRHAVGLVPQETLLFSGSVFENICYGKPKASQAEVWAAAQAANAHDFIMQFPQGYDTVVGERGVKLSGGQRQRVAIARAILKNPRILLLDEATSALDSESEAVVQEALDRLMQSRTTFVIAHRLSTIRNASRIVVLDRGQVVAEGTHEALLAAGGLYSDLYERQFRENGAEG